MDEKWLWIEIEVNKERRRLQVASHETLLEVLRQRLELRGTKQGCGSGQCGSCTVLLNGHAVNACTLLAVQAHGQAIETIEGVATADRLHPLQEAFIAEHAIQCGYCTPGMIMSAKALLDKTPRPAKAEIREALSGNVCRCTGYTKIVKAVKRAADRIAANGGGAPTTEVGHDRL